MAVSTVQLVQLFDRSVQPLMVALQGMQKSPQVSLPLINEVVTGRELIVTKISKTLADTEKLTNFILNFNSVKCTCSLKSETNYSNCF